MKPLNFLALILFLAGAVWALTLSPSRVRDIHKNYYKFISPFLQAGGKSESYANNFVKEAEHSDVLKSRLVAIQSEFGRLQAIESRFRELERENSDLRSALNFKERTRFEVIPASIIRRKPSTWWETVVINKGQEKLIKAEDPVVSSQGLVGKTNESAEGTATILLLTDESCQVSAKVDGTPEVGIVSGQRVNYGQSPTLRLRFLSRDSQLKAGMKVYTTGRGGLFPPDLLIGTIVTQQTNALDSEAVIKPSVDFESLSSLFVIIE